MHIGVPLETHAGETRVAATPETIKKLVGQGHQVTVQAGAGISASIPDSAYQAAGATIGNDSAAFGADLVLSLIHISTRFVSALSRRDLCSGDAHAGGLHPSR